MTHSFNLIEMQNVPSGSSSRERNDFYSAWNMIWHSDNIVDEFEKGITRWKSFSNIGILMFEGLKEVEERLNVVES